ncbi:MAG TPA: hypothetical protein VFV87_13845, partial [Pirellulaceae bacterium]|nr:hypothetical protein [Pirellulaceae bacterium]
LERPQPDRDELDVAAHDVQAILLNGDSQALQRACTAEGWKYVNQCYDFHLGALGFKGTFADFMRDCGERMRASDPSDVVKESFNDGTAVIYFDYSFSEGVTIAFCKRKGQWRIAGFSPGRIAPESFFPAGSKYPAALK